MLKDLMLTEDSQDIKEKIIWHMSQRLKIPAVTISLEPPEEDTDHPGVKPDVMKQRGLFKSDRIRVEV